VASPDFVMPPEAAPAPSAVPEPARGRADATAPDPTAPGSTSPTDGAVRRMPWRQMVVAGLIGALIGAAVPAGVLAVEQAAVDADAERLRSTAMTYLTAIAEGDAALATAMVALPGAADIAPDAVLRAAAPIAAPEVRFVTIDGDAASVEVRFELGERQVTRTLQADRDDGSWRLGTSLAEPVNLYAGAWQLGDTPSGVRVGGVVLPPGPGTWLYPGRYRIDITQTRQLRTGGDPFMVDGNRATPTEAFARTTPTEEFATAAVAVARARVGACQLLAECPIDAQTVADPVDALSVSEVDPAGGTIDLLVPLGLGLGFGGTGEELRLRALVDDAGSVVGWECSEAGAPQGALEPCGP
jgi:hypothetical protein